MVGGRLYTISHCMPLLATYIRRALVLLMRRHRTLLQSRRCITHRNSFDKKVEREALHSSYLRTCMQYSVNSGFKQSTSRGKGRTLQSRRIEFSKCEQMTQAAAQARIELDLFNLTHNDWHAYGQLRRYCSVVPLCKVDVSFKPGEVRASVYLSQRTYIP